MIEFKDVSKHYKNGKNALSEVSFLLGKGEMAFLTGRSGAGKSTVLKLIAKLEDSSKGEVIVNNTSLKKVKKHQVPQLRRSMGVILQQPMLLNDRCVFDNVAMPLVIAGYSRSDIKRRVHAALDKVALLSAATKLPTHLSSGEQQRIGIARAVVHKPDVLIADEPTGNLDPALSAEIMQLFEEFNSVGVSVLIASHDLALIATMKHRIITLNNGHLV